MSRGIRSLLIGMVMVLSASIVYAEEGAGGPARPPRPPRPPEGMRMGQLGQMGPIGPMGMMESEAAKAEKERHRTAMEPVLKEAGALREAMRKDIEGGATPKDALKNHIEEAKALAKKMIAEFATHTANMAKIIQDEAPAAVDKLAERLLKPPMGPGREMKPGEAPERPRRPHAEGERPEPPAPPTNE